MGLVLGSWITLLVVAIMVALIARRLSLPYTVGLVATGAVLSFAHLDFGVTLTHDFIYLVILPPLLFEAALSLHWDELRRDFLPVLVLSILGVCISAGVVAWGMHGLLGWPLGPAVVFGVLIAATDPVAVIALFKDLGLKGRLRLLVESESLFNDGVAAVLFSLALGWALTSAGAPLDTAAALQALVLRSGGGIAVGLAVGGITLLLAGRTGDAVVSGAVTSAAAYGSFLVSEHLNVSGVLATVTAGMLIGNMGVLNREQLKSFTEPERQFVTGLWSFAAFIAKSFIFLLIGLAIARVPFAWL